VTIKVFHGDAKTIVRENSSLLQDATLTQRLGFPDVGFPGDVRNEVYVKLWSGDFSSINTANSRLSVMGITRGNVVPTSNNIEVTVELREPGGRAVEPPALYLGTGEPPVAQFRSMVLQKNSQPTYGELFKVRLPDKVGQPWHLFFTFRNRGAREGRNAGRAADSQDKPFAFAFLPLFPQNQTFLDDGGHTLVLYRADRLSAITPDLYRSATPVLSPGQRMDQIAMSADMQRNAPPLRDTLTVRTSLASTKLTQNGILFTLLNWRKVEDTGMLSTVLSKFVFVGETELVKFLRDIFDALFGILGSNQNAGGALDQLVFTGLVTMLGIIQDRRFRNYKPMLDVYIERHFDQPAATPRLIRSMNRLLQADPNAGSASALRAALKVWDYIFKFVARSVNPPNAHGGEGAMFHQVALEHLAAVNGMMAATAPAAIIGTQTIALQHFASILPQLAHIFRPMELVNIATEFVDALAAAKGKLVIWKLSVYLQLAKSFLFDDADARAALVEAIAMWIRPYFGVFDAYAQTQDADGSLDAARIAWLESSRLCITIIAVMLDKLQECLVDPDITANPRLLRKEQDNVELLLPLLPRCVCP
jgi:dedicator of cytokinesis protein 3